MKNFLYLILISMLICSCSSPRSTSKDFLDAMNNSQFETAMSLVSEDSQPIFYSLIHDQTQEIPKFDIQIKECSSVREQNQVACIYIISNEEGEIAEKLITLVKEKNNWKVDLTR